MKRLVGGRLGRLAISTLLVAAITYVYFAHVHVNSATVGFTLLLGVLVVSAQWGLVCALFMSVIAVLAYNFFFLPPIGTFTIADPQNWIALGTFLIAAVIASNLAERARQQALNANLRRREVERLYSLSQQLLAFENIPELLNEIPRQVVACFGLTSAGFYLLAGNRSYYSDLASETLLGQGALQEAAERGPSVDDGSAKRFAPLRVGVRSIGALGVIGDPVSRETMEAIAGLVATAIERATTMEQLSRAEAARENEKLRTVLLDSVTHEFRTPLTSILASAKAMLLDDHLNDAARLELLIVINEEGERLNRLVGEAAEMAQLDAHQVELEIAPHDLRYAVEGAMEDCNRTLAGHPVEVAIPDALPRAQMDPKRIQEVIAHLLDNAAKYSAPDTPIRVSAELKGNMVVTSVADRGPGIDAIEQDLIFDKFYRGRGQRKVQGTGMGLAIVKAIIEAHGGQVGLISQPGSGSVFYFTLHAAQPS